MATAARGGVILLASASPRRAALLRQLGLVFEVRAPRVDEALAPNVTPDEAVLGVAGRKADAVAASASPHDVILAADTVAWFRDHAIGKPRDAPDARRILAHLSGQTHQVLTGVEVRRGNGQRFRAVEATEVTFAALSPAQIEAYVATGEPLDKAAAYGIQGRGAALVAGIRGDYTNVVGLPLRRTLELLAAAGAELPPHLRP